MATRNSDSPNDKTKRLRTATLESTRYECQWHHVRRPQIQVGRQQPPRNRNTRRRFAAWTKAAGRRRLTGYASDKRDAFDFDDPSFTSLPDVPDSDQFLFPTRRAKTVPGARNTTDLQRRRKKLQNGAVDARGLPRHVRRLRRGITGLLHDMPDLDDPSLAFFPDTLDSDPFPFPTMHARPELPHTPRAAGMRDFNPLRAHLRPTDITETNTEESRSISINAP
ncbi:hypothetical protein B0H14DRAFT_3481352 [Mycena olivaceomarginata]|nr:hypothetical protein B0H14DRAFT_3481352 [Mycena olivaceomarginata]